MFMRGINKLLQGSKREVKDISGKGEERDPQELILKVGLEGQEEFCQMETVGGKFYAKDTE